jgi:hypothetical protein
MGIKRRGWRGPQLGKSKKNKPIRYFMGGECMGPFGKYIEFAL